MFAFATESTKAPHRRLYCKLRIRCPMPIAVFRAGDAEIFRIRCSDNIERSGLPALQGAGHANQAVSTGFSVGVIEHCRNRMNETCQPVLGIPMSAILARIIEVPYVAKVGILAICYFAAPLTS